MQRNICIVCRSVSVSDPSNVLIPCYSTPSTITHNPVSLSKLPQTHTVSFSPPLSYRVTGTQEFCSRNGPDVESGPFLEQNSFEVNGMRLDSVNCTVNCTHTRTRTAAT
jgi:hypothetical protein